VKWRKLLKEQILKGQEEGRMPLLGAKKRKGF
jgi:hypothetical protein